MKRSPRFVTRSGNSSISAKKRRKLAAKAREDIKAGKLDNDRVDVDSDDSDGR